MSIYSYKLTVDSGFAPNPFWGHLTLATCKPGLREHRREGEWIAGWTSTTLCGDPVGEERLVYLMEIGERMTFADYFNDKRFQSKIPVQHSRSYVNCCGDNIYKPMVEDAYLTRHFVQIENVNHGANEKLYDLGSMSVLVANRFVYFGCRAINIPDSLRPRVPKGQARFGHSTHCPIRSQKLIDFVFNAAGGSTILGQPHCWPDGDSSWSNPTIESKGSPVTNMLATCKRSTCAPSHAVRFKPKRC